MRVGRDCNCRAADPSIEVDLFFGIWNLRATYSADLLGRFFVGGHYFCGSFGIFPRWVQRWLFFEIDSNRQKQNVNDVVF